MVERSRPTTRTTSANSAGFQQLNADDSAPLFNRATQAGYPPGSTMKVVTATAALDSGEFTPDSIAQRRLAAEISGVPLENSGGEQLRRHRHDLRADQLGQHLAGPRSARSSARTRCSSTWTASASTASPRSTIPSFQLAPSGVFDGNKLLDQQRPDRHRPRRDRPGAAAGDAAADGRGRRRGRQRRRADGAAAVGEGDRPRRARDEARARASQSRVMSEDTAVGADQMMTTSSTREPAAPRRSPAIQVAGKTGTAEIDRRRGDQPGLVHRLRARRRPADRGRGDGRAHERLRRHGRGADRAEGR